MRITGGRGPMSGSINIRSRTTERSGNVTLSTGTGVTRSGQVILGTGDSENKVGAIQLVVGTSATETGAAMQLEAGTGVSGGRISIQSGREYKTLDIRIVDLVVDVRSRIVSSNFLD